MPKIINIEKNYEIGNILAQIKTADEQKIVLQVSSTSNFLFEKSDVAIVNNFAKKLGKTTSIQDTHRFEKLGFAPGKDVSNEDVEVSPKTEEVKKTTKKFKMPGIALPIKGKMAIPIVIVLIFLLLGGSLITAGYYYLPQATIKVKLDSQVFTGTKDVLASTNVNSINVDERTIPATLITATVEETLTELATGEKETGNKATGTIELFNKTSDDIELDAGTKIIVKIDKENLEYLVDEDVEVPAKKTEEVTTEQGETTKAEVYGRKKVNITAASFGEKYNLEDVDEDDYSVSVDDYNNKELEVELEDIPDGGSTKKVTVVTEKDREALKEKVEKSVNKKAFDALKAKTVDSQQLNEGAVEYAVISEFFDAEVDEETDKINLTMQVQAKALVFSKEDLRQVLEQLIKDIVPQNYKVNENRENYNIVTTVKQKNANTETTELESLDLTNKVQSYVIPEIDEDKIKKDLSGLSINKAQEYLANISNISEAEIVSTTSKLPEPFNKLPQRVENIEIEIIAE